MIKQILILFITITLFAACTSESDSINNSGGISNANNGSQITLPGMGYPANPIPDSLWNGNWNDPANANYPGKDNIYNPIQGYWILTAANGVLTQEFVAYKITPDLYMHLLTNKPAEGVLPPFNSTDSIRYQINNTQLKIEPATNNAIADPKQDLDYIYNYSISPDRSMLMLNDGTNTYTLSIYDNNNIWYWKGNWNSPHNPYYSVYHGKYNPIQGIWKVVYTDMVYDYFDGYYYQYNDNYSIGTSKVLSQSLPRVRTYQINDNGIYETVDQFTSEYYKYTLRNDTLNLERQSRYNATNRNRVATLVRIKN